MRVVVLGGTGFIGRYVVRALVKNHHEVTVFHRGIREPDLPSSIRHIHAPFERLIDHRAELRRLAPEVVLDMVPYLDKGGHGTAHFRGVADRAVVISSGDVYRAFARLWKSEPGRPDPVPLREDAPLRRLQAPDQKPVDAFDNLEVEAAALADRELPATILRLPATHGPGDRQHRLAPYLRSIHDGRHAIVLGESQAHWRWSRGYVGNVAAAIALAVEDQRAEGRIYNVGAEPVLREAEWVRAIARVTGWEGELHVLPEEQLPAALCQPFDFKQHLQLDTTAVRSELGFREPIAEGVGLRRTVEWELKTLDEVPNLRLNYSAEDEALANLG